MPSPAPLANDRTACVVSPADQRSKGGLVESLPPQTLLTLMFWGGFLLKLALSAALPLTDDEAYYRVWSLHLQLSYYDHPAMIALLYRIGDAVNWLPGMVRWGGVALSQATLALWLRILKPRLSIEQRTCWLALALLSPMIDGRAGVLVQPDLPLMFFYALSFSIFLRWRERPNALDALALGLAMGLGFDSKYMMIFFPLALLPIVLTTPALRGPFLRHLPLVVAAGIVACSPVWIWNLQNDFASFKFQLGARVGGGHFNLHTPAAFLGGQIALIFPPVLYWAVKARKLPIEFHAVAWTPLAFFFCMSTWVVVQGKWPSVAYLPIFALAASGWPRNRSSMLATLAIWGAVLIGFSAAMTTRPSFIPEHMYQTCDCGRLVAATRDLSPLYADSYQTAASLDAALGRPVYKLRGMTRMDFYDFIPQSIPTASTFFVAARPGEVLPDIMRARGAQIVATQPVDSEYVVWTVHSPSALAP